MIIRHYLKKICWICICFFSLTTPHVAAQDLNMAEADFFDELPLILTASRMNKPLAESPASVSVISRPMIEASGARELSELFRMVPGFIVGNESGNNPVVTYQGLGNKFHRQLQVLVDGRSVFIPSFGGVPWANLPLLVEDIERIEVIRGPNAVTYGTNAFLATVNIITRHAAEDHGARYAITTSAGSYPDVNDAYFRYGYQTDHLDWRVSAGSLNDDGFAGVYDSRETNKLNIRLDYQASQNQIWTIHTGTSNTVSGKGEAENADNLERDEDARNSYFNINWEQVRADSSTSIRLTHTTQDVTDNFLSGPIDLSGLTVVAFVDFDRSSRRTDLEFIQTEQLSPDFRIVYGAGVRRDSIKSKFLLNENKYQDLDTSRLFTDLEWRLGKGWILGLGTSLEDSTITDRESSPRVSALYSLNQNHVARFVASRAKRNPILYEHSGLTFFSVTTIDPIGDVDLDVKTFEGNPEILPEDLVSYEIGLRSQFLNRKISSDIKIFTYKLTDFITDTELEGILSTPFGPADIKFDTADNLHSLRVYGIEFAFDISPVQGLDIRTGLSFINVDTENRNIEASFPDSSGFITANYRWQDLHSLAGSLYYVDEMEWLDARGDIPAYSKFDIRYAYLLDSASETRLELIGQNLLEDFTDYLNDNINERSYLVRITGGF
jgi:iron complex outermembrane receptor protein